MWAINVHHIANTSIEKNFSRKELLNWMNQCLGINLSKLEELSSGEYYCELFNILFPKTIPMNRVKHNAVSQYECYQNFRLLQEAFKKRNVLRVIEIEKLTKTRYADLFEFLQWFQKFADANGCKEKVVKYSKAKVSESTRSKAKVKPPPPKAPQKLNQELAKSCTINKPPVPRRDQNLVYGYLGNNTDTSNKFSCQALLMQRLQTEKTDFDENIVNNVSDNSASPNEVSEMDDWRSQFDSFLEDLEGNKDGNFGFPKTCYSKAEEHQNIDEVKEQGRFYYQKLHMIEVNSFLEIEKNDSRTAKDVLKIIHGSTGDLQKWDDFDKSDKTKD